jgi:hypothetical protein
VPIDASVDTFPDTLDAQAALNAILSSPSKQELRTGVAVDLNDGFGGGDVVRGNLVFNMVRETNDHGA